MGNSLFGSKDATSNNEADNQTYNNSEGDFFFKHCGFIVTRFPSSTNDRNSSKNFFKKSSGQPNVTTIVAVLIPVSPKIG